MTITAVQAKVTKTATFDGSSIDISAITNDWTLVLEVMAMNSGDTIRFQFSDSVDAFSTVLAGPTFSVTGQISDAAHTPAYPSVKRFTVTKRDFPDLRLGTASAVLRLSITAFSGSSKSVVYQSWIES